MGAIKSDPVKRLWGLAAGRCSYCRKWLLEEEVHIGEMAHIIAESDDGPRGDEVFHGDRNGYGNLILLCPTHHRMVDKNPKKYKVDILREWKASHEEWVEARLNTTRERDLDLDSLTLIFRAIPFTKLRSYLQYAPQKIDTRFSGLEDVMESFMIDRPHAYPFDDSNLTRLFEDFRAKHRKVMRWVFGVYKDIQVYSNSASYPRNVHIEILQVREFEAADRTILIDRIESSIVAFDRSYEQLIRFLRMRYSEVELDAYEEYKVDC